jgi:hypothetical protein
MRTIVILLTFFFSVSIKAQDSLKLVEIKPVGWIIYIPANCKIIDTTRADGKNIFFASNLTFELSVIPDSSKNESEWKNNMKKETTKFFNITSKSSFIEVDSYSRQISIDGINFKKCVVDRSINGSMVGSNRMIYALQKGHTIRVFYFGYRKSIEEFEQLLKNSKFSK